jgi:hypothetical protein
MAGFGMRASHLEAVARGLDTDGMTGLAFIDALLHLRTHLMWHAELLLAGFVQRSATGEAGATLR